MIANLKARAEDLEKRFYATEAERLITEKAMEKPWRFDNACTAAFASFELCTRMNLYFEDDARSDVIAIAKHFFINRRKQALDILQNGKSDEDDRDPWTAGYEENIVDDECRFALDEIEAFEAEIDEMLS